MGKRPETLDLPALRERLLREPPAAEAIAAPVTSDDAAGLVDGPLRAAAVLVPVVLGAAPGILLTLRTSHLRSHAGQVAFPGGRIEPEDASPEEAALREAEEEVGLAPGDVQVVGRLPGYVTGTGYHITPVLGLVPEGLALVPNPEEVEALFWLPMATLLDPGAPERRSRVFRGRERHFWVWPHETHYIWGATAGILVNLAARLRAAA